MQRLEAGPRVYAFNTGVATLSFTPLFDRAANITSIQVLSPSGNDNWILTVGGREIMRFRVLTTGNQQLLGTPTATIVKPMTLFDYLRDTYFQNFSVPIPLGITATLSSVGGATATVMMEMMEVDPSDIVPTMINHYQGSSFVLPVSFYLNTSQTVVGTIPFDTFVAPAWVPNPITGLVWPVGWRAKLLAAFFEAGSVNTFSGAANHVSQTNYIAAVKNGQSLLTRTTQGVPLIAAAAAAGSANTVLNSILTEFLPFQNTSRSRDNSFDPAITLVGGDLMQWSLNISGDETGGASYATALQHLIMQLDKVG